VAVRDANRGDRPARAQRFKVVICHLRGELLELAIPTPDVALVTEALGEAVTP
jgi:hypothetical protein